MFNVKGYLSMLIKRTYIIVAVLMIFRNDSQTKNKIETAVELFTVYCVIELSFT